MLSNRQYFAHFLGGKKYLMLSVFCHIVVGRLSLRLVPRLLSADPRTSRKQHSFFFLQYFSIEGIPPFRTLIGHKNYLIYIDFHWFPWFFLWQNVTSSEAQYLNVGGTMSQSQGTSHPSRWKLQCPQYDFPYEMEYYGKSQWLCPSSIFPLELLHLQDKLCGQTVTYLISLHVSGQGFYLMMILMNVLMVMVVTGDY